MSNKEERERKEIDNLLKDPKMYRKVWQSIGRLIAQRPATILPTIVDKDGNETLPSMISNYGYKALTHDIASLTRDDGAPTELEMILACQMIKARTDTQAATFVRDTLGAKPVDESKAEVLTGNMFEQLSDDELEALAAYRASKMGPDGQAPDDNIVEPEVPRRWLDTTGDQGRGGRPQGAGYADRALKHDLAKECGEK
uniref:Uncharacterized protein n=1 Tax=Podoviridae sp. ctaNW81 TaxID=2826562 RepID=A0A8S5M5D3_9CAUD|nr:MAG TPA: hypothetical protein [Podoviridae sp. ctaNW81]